MRHRNLAAVIAILVACSLVWVGLFMAGWAIAHESGLMENFQVAFLGLGALLLVRASTRVADFAPRLFFLALALFFISFLVREIEVEDWNLPRFLAYVLDGKPRNLWVGTLWLVLFVLFCRHARPVWQVFLTWIKTPAGRLLIAGGVLYALSWPLDKGLVKLSDAAHMFSEELLDTHATLLMLLSAITTHQEAGNAGWKNHEANSRTGSAIGRS